MVRARTGDCGRRERSGRELHRSESRPSTSARRWSESSPSTVSGLVAASSRTRVDRDDATSRIYVHTSARLIEVLGALGKYSNNFSAEQMIKALGSAPLRTSLEASRPAGRAVGEYLVGLGFSKNDFHIEDGSGPLLRQPPDRFDPVPRSRGPLPFARAPNRLHLLARSWRGGRDAPPPVPQREAHGAHHGEDRQPCFGELAVGLRVLGAESRPRCVLGDHERNRPSVPGGPRRERDRPGAPRLLTMEVERGHVTLMTQWMR